MVLNFVSMTTSVLVKGFDEAAKDFNKCFLWKYVGRFRFTPQPLVYGLNNCTSAWHIPMYDHTAALQGKIFSAQLTSVLVSISHVVWQGYWKQMYGWGSQEKDATFFPWMPEQIIPVIRLGLVTCIIILCFCPPSRLWEPWPCCWKFSALDVDGALRDRESSPLHNIIVYNLPLCPQFLV